LYYPVKDDKLPPGLTEVVQYQNPGRDKMDPVIIVNLVLTIVIFALGIWAYVSKKSDVALYIGVAFGLFAISHLVNLLGLAAALTVLLIVIRVIAYLLVIFALYRIIAKKK
jgi:hypothetical protein